MAKKRSLLLVLAGFAAVAAITSCTAFKMSGLEIHQTATTGTSVGNFELKVPVKKFFCYAAGSSAFNNNSDVMEPAITKAIQDEIQNRGGTAAINVKVEYKATGWNYFLNAITFTIYAPSTVVITGTIIK